jgi:prepilin-type N-terminal cleavage/methylation domain-containing protein
VGTNREQVGKRVKTLIEQRARTAAAERRALTLLEVLLTLSIIAAGAAIIWPNLQRPFAQQRLRSAGDQIRTAMNAARIRALSSGHVHALHYTTGSNQYRLECYQEPGAQESTVSSFDVADAGADPSAASFANYTLPDGILLLGGQEGDKDQMRSNQQVSLADRAKSAEDVCILFFPDGTTSSARVLLAGEYDRFVTVNLRGLTGVATVGPVLGSQELPQ